MKTCIVLPGHSTVRGANGAYRSTGLYQEVSYPKTGCEFPFVRTGIDTPDLCGDDSTAYLGGGQTVIQAGIKCSRLLESKGRSVEFLLMAGRPDYLDNVAQDDPLLSEGSVMADEIRKELGPDTIIQIYDRGVTTKDDALNILQVAMSEIVDQILVVTMTFRIGRLESLFAEISLQSPELAENLCKVRILPAEFALDPEEIVGMTLSEAYKRTMENERFGLRQALIDGKVATTGGKT